MQLPPGGRARAASQRSNGTVKMFSDIKGYGFIAADDGEDIFVHYSGIAATGYRYLLAGERVRFAIAASPKRPIATKPVRRPSRSCHTRSVMERPHPYIGTFRDAL